MKNKIGIALVIMLIVGLFISYTGVFTSKNKDYQTGYDEGYKKGLENRTQEYKDTSYNEKKNSIKQDINTTEFKGYTHIVNLNTKKIHYPDCESVKKMKDKNKGYTNNIENVKMQGYQSCKICNP